MVLQDKTKEKKTIDHPLAKVPFRSLLTGKSLISGKTNWISNLLLRPYSDSDEEGKKIGYRHIFDPSNIYIVSPTADTDPVWRTIISELGIPQDNIMSGYNEERMQSFYDGVVSQYHMYAEMNIEAPHTLLILDDIAFSGSLKDKNYGVIAELACNSRHYKLSVILTCQKYSQVNTVFRENMSLGVFFGCSKKQKELIELDHNYLDTKKEFIDMFTKNTDEKHSYVICRYDDGLLPDRLYFDQYLCSCITGDKL